MSVALDGISDEERELTKGMPDQVAIGYIKARRKDQGTGGLGDIFEAMFGPREKQ